MKVIALIPEETKAVKLTDSEYLQVAFITGIIYSPSEFRRIKNKPKGFIQRQLTVDNEFNVI